jgi:hypothetical protein
MNRNESLLAILLFSIVGSTVLTAAPLQLSYSSSTEETNDEEQPGELGGDTEEPVDKEPVVDEPESEPEPSLPPSTSVQPELPDQASNVSLSGYPYPHILPPTGFTENGDEENTTQTEQTVAERGGGNPLKGLNVIPQTGEKPLPPCTPGGPTPCLVKK